MTENLKYRLIGTMLSKLIIWSRNSKRPDIRKLEKYIFAYLYSCAYSFDAHSDQLDSMKLDALTLGVSLTDQGVLISDTKVIDFTLPEKWIKDNE